MQHLACVQDVSYYLFFTWKRDVCMTPLLIVFQYQDGSEICILNYIDVNSELVLFGKQETDSSKRICYSGEADVSTLSFPSILISFFAVSTVHLESLRTLQRCFQIFHKLMQSQSSSLL